MDLYQVLSPVNIILFISILTRITGLLSSAPLFSNYPIPMMAKAWFAALVAFILFPMVSANVHFIMPTTVPELALILIKEFFIGFAIGFCAKIIFVGVEMGVNMFAIQMGLAADQALNPTSGGSSPIITQAYTWLLTMIFIAVCAHHWLFSAVYRSFINMPMGYGFIFDSTIVHQIIVISCQMFSVGLQIALPIFGILLITDVLLGFTSKMMPQMNIFMVSIPLKVYLGLFLSLIFMKPIASTMEVLLERLIMQLAVVF